MYRYIIVTICSFICICQSSSQTLHALLFVNIQEQGREIDRKADMNNMYTFWKNVAGSIGYKYSPTQCTPSTFTATKVNDVIDDLSTENDDIVVFYYSGHGYNDETDIWPSLNFSDKNYRQIDIMKRINKSASNSKLILCIADCCNKQLTSSYDFTSSYGSFENNNCLTKLFLGYKGKKSIMMSASKQGQFSWSNLLGAYYGRSIRQVITNLSMPNPTWDIVLKEISDLTYKSTNGLQTPQFNITQSGDPFE